MPQLVAVLIGKQGGVPGIIEAVLGIIVIRGATFGIQGLMLAKHMFTIELCPISHIRLLKAVLYLKQQASLFLLCVRLLNAGVYLKQQANLFFTMLIYYVGNGD